MPGLTTALIVGSAISAGTQVASAAIGAKGAKSAAKTQAEASRQASSDLKETMAPYINTGAQAMTTLGSLMGLGGGGGDSSLAPPSAAPGFGARTMPPSGVPTGRFAAPRPTGVMPTPMPMQQAAQQSQSSYGAPSGPEMVRVQAPDGEVRLLPRHVADQYIARGATQV